MGILMKTKNPNWLSPYYESIPPHQAVVSEKAHSLWLGVGVKTVILDDNEAIQEPR